MAYAYKTSTQKAGAEGSQVQDQAGLYSKICLKKTRKDIFKT